MYNIIIIMKSFVDLQELYTELVIIATFCWFYVRLLSA
jgi:hypothetical protein